MDEQSPTPPTRGSQFTRFLLVAAAVAVIIVVLKMMSSFLVLFLQAGFLAVISAQPVSYLARRKVPRVVAVLLVVLVIFILIALVVTLLVTGVRQAGADLYRYQSRVQTLLAELAEPLARAGFEVPLGEVETFLDPKEAVRTAARLAGDLGGIIARLIFVMLIVIYSLLDAPKIKRRLQAMARTGEDSTERDAAHFSGMMYRYLIIKTWISLGTGLTAGLLIAIIGVDYAMLWSLLAVVLNFIPQVGSVIAAIPAILLAFLTLGVAPGFLTMGSFLLANIIFGNILEPRFLGIGFGLPVAMVLFSLVFWGWIFGATGVFLAVPLTMSLVFALQRAGGAENLTYLMVGSSVVRPLRSRTKS